MNSGSERIDVCRKMQDVSFALSACDMPVRNIKKEPSKPLKHLSKW